MAHQMTREQEDILAAYRTGNHIVIQAGAGTGKTTTIEMLASDMAARGLYGIYVTFNKSVAEDVGSRFVHGNITASTFHSLALSLSRTEPFISSLLHRLSGESNVGRYQMASHLGVEEVVRYKTFQDVNREHIGFQGKYTTINSTQLTLAALDALSVWCQTDADDLGIEHVKRPTIMPEDQFEEIYAPVVQRIALHAWTSDILNPNGRLPFTHDYYLKLVSMAGLNFVERLGIPPGSVLFFDEAQDSRPSMTALLRAQTNPQRPYVDWQGQTHQWPDGQIVTPRMQLVAVGDSSQAIYGSFTGARDALPGFSSLPGAITLPLTTSWRFGSEIADLANETLDALEAPIRLHGNPSMLDMSTTHTYNLDEDRPCDPDAILVRSNARLIDEALTQIRAGRKVHLVTDVERLKRLVGDFDRVCDGERAFTMEMRDFTSREHIEEFVASTDSGGDPTLRTLLTHLVNKGSGPILEALAQSVSAEEADTVISTIHKSKGRQWDRVVVAGDPEELVPGSMQHVRQVHDYGSGEMTFEAREALMLLYVAMTRARKELHISATVMVALRDVYSRHREVVSTSGGADPLSVSQAG